MKIIEKAVLDVLKPVDPCGNVYFNVTSENGKMLCFPVINLYYQDIWYWENMPRMKHGLAVSRT